jgi:branched-chain amino acid transport system permease protein
VNFATFVTMTVDGLAQGAAISAFALALVLIWRAARVVNFAQGAMAAASAYIAITVIQHTGSFWLGLVGALISGAIFGVFVESSVMRFASHTAPLNAVILALGSTFIIQGALGAIYGPDLRDPGNPFSHAYRMVAGVGLPSDLNLFTFVSVAIMVVGLVLLFSKTKLGLRLRASAFAPEVSRLLGINVSFMRTVGWALAATAGALAAEVILPTQLGVNPNAMDGVFVTAFTAAVLGGLDSPIGAVVGGMILGLVLNYVTGFVNPVAPPVATLVVLLLVLLVRPNGIFAGVKERHV